MWPTERLLMWLFPGGHSGSDREVVDVVVL